MSSWGACTWHSLLHTACCLATIQNLHGMQQVGIAACGSSTSSPPPTHALCSNCERVGRARGAKVQVQILQKLKIRWPDDVTLLAFDEPVWAPILSPPLSVVRHPTQRIALEAWNRLLSRTRSPGLRPKRITLEAELVATDSIGSPKGAIACFKVGQ